MEILYCLTLLHSEWPKLHRVLAILSAIALKEKFKNSSKNREIWPYLTIKEGRLGVPPKIGKSPIYGRELTGMLSVLSTDPVQYKLAVDREFTGNHYQ